MAERNCLWASHKWKQLFCLSEVAKQLAQPRRNFAMRLGNECVQTMDAPVTKRLIISGLTPSITADDISRRLISFGTVKAADGFGLSNAVGETRKFGYVTLETTTGKLTKCKDFILSSVYRM